MSIAIFAKNIKERLYRLLLNHSITSIYFSGLLLLFIAVTIFTALTIYIEYKNFNQETVHLKNEYIQEQKEQIYFDTNRVLNYINHSYKDNHNIIDTNILKSQIIYSIEKLYGRRDGTGYIFIYDFNGTCISDPIQPSHIGKNLYDFKDPDGIQVIKELIEVSRSKDGGYLRYRWLKPTSGKISPKISYAKSFDRWGWMVGTGVYLDEVEKVIASKREALREKTLSTIFKIVTLMILLAFIGFIGVVLLNKIISKEVDRLTKYFDIAAKRYVAIDEKRIFLVEFKPMVRSINKMVNEIHKREYRLKEANRLLESRIEKKTKDLKDKNRQLANEKIEKDNLIKTQDSFIKSAIHEINTPLAVIITYIDIFKMKYGNNKYLSKIEAATKMISTIYDDLGYMVKKDRFEYPRQMIDMKSFIEDRIRFFNDIAKENKLYIEPHLQSGLKVYFNDIELQRVVDNNISNSIKYAKSFSYIIISLFEKDNRIYLEFATQSRKPIEDTQKIFQEYHREDKERDGFGLGLVIVKTICDRNGVEIEVESKSESTYFRYIFQKAGDSHEDRIA